MRRRHQSNEVELSMLPISSSKRLIEQRVRNRLIDYLEAVVDYERDSPLFDLNEVVNQWEDWVTHPLLANQFPQPVYTILESRLLRAVDRAWEEFCSATAQSILESSIHSVEWSAFVSSSLAALNVLRERGRLPEDEELP